MQTGTSVSKSKSKWQTVDPDEMAHYEPSHLDLHCLQRYRVRSAGLKGLNMDMAHNALLSIVPDKRRFRTCVVLRFYGAVNPMGSCRAWSVYRLLGRLSPLSG